MKYLGVALLSLSACSNAPEYTHLGVNRILEQEVHEVKAGESFKFWREVCPYQDVVIKVHRQYIDRIAALSVMRPSVDYGFVQSGECSAIMYEVPVPDLPPSVYHYTPILSYMDSGKEVLQKLPDEIIRVVE